MGNMSKKSTFSTYQALSVDTIDLFALPKTLGQILSLEVGIEQACDFFGERDLLQVAFDSGQFLVSQIEKMTHPRG